MRRERSDRGRARQSTAAQIEEMVALDAQARERALSAEESERFGVLISREQRRAAYRPARIARLRAELEFLEALEIAQHGPVALPAPDPRKVELFCGDDGCWSAEKREAA